MLRRCLLFHRRNKPKVMRQWTIMHVISAQECHQLFHLFIYFLFFKWYVIVDLWNCERVQSIKKPLGFNFTGRTRGCLRRSHCTSCCRRSTGPLTRPTPSSASISTPSSSTWACWHGRRDTVFSPSSVHSNPGGLLSYEGIVILNMTLSYVR